MTKYASRTATTACHWQYHMTRAKQPTKQKRRLLILCGVLPVALFALGARAQRGRKIPPAFGRPYLVGNRHLVAVSERGGEVVCLDYRAKSVEWRTLLGKDHLTLLAGGPSDRLCVADNGRLVEMLATTGEVLESHTTEGRAFAVDGKGVVFLEGPPSQECVHLGAYDLSTRKILWRSCIQAPESNIDSRLCGNRIFACLWPTQLVFSGEVSRIARGECRLVCLRANDGHILWTRPMWTNGHCTVHSFACETNAAGSSFFWAGPLLQTADTTASETLHQYLSPGPILDVAFGGTEEILVLSDETDGVVLTFLDTEDFALNRRLLLGPDAGNRILAVDKEHVYVGGRFAVDMDDGQTDVLDFRHPGYAIDEGPVQGSVRYFGSGRRTNVSARSTRLIAAWDVRKNVFEVLLEEPNKPKDGVQADGATNDGNESSRASPRTSR